MDSESAWLVVSRMTSVEDIDDMILGEAGPTLPLSGFQALSDAREIVCRNLAGPACPAAADDQDTSVPRSCSHWGAWLGGHSARGDASLALLAAVCTDGGCTEIQRKFARVAPRPASRKEAEGGPYSTC